MADVCPTCRINQLHQHDALCPACSPRNIPKNDISDNLYTFTQSRAYYRRNALKDTKMARKNELSLQKFDEVIEEHLQRAHALASELANLGQSVGGRATEDEMAAMGARLTTCAADDFRETQKALAELRTIFLHGDIFSELMEKFDDC